MQKKMMLKFEHTKIQDISTLAILVIKEIFEFQTFFLNRIPSYCLIHGVDACGLLPRMFAGQSSLHFSVIS